MNNIGKTIEKYITRPVRQIRNIRRVIIEGYWYDDIGFNISYLDLVLPRHIVKLQSSRSAHLVLAGIWQSSLEQYSEETINLHKQATDSETLNLALGTVAPELIRSIIVDDGRVFLDLDRIQITNDETNPRGSFIYYQRLLQGSFGQGNPLIYNPKFIPSATDDTIRLQ